MMGWSNNDDCTSTWSSTISPFFACADRLEHARTINSHAICYMMVNHSLQWHPRLCPEVLLAKETFFTFLVTRSLQHNKLGL